MLYNLFEDRDFVSVFAVALLAEGVDRNGKAGIINAPIKVALLAEGVDRNFHAIALVIVSTVALLAEGVDRNLLLRFTAAAQAGSPSSRRAWIEIKPSL